MADSKTSRRSLLRKGAAGALGFTIVPRFVLGGNGHTPPSEELTKGVVGTGGMGMGHVNMPGSRLLAVCDVDANRRQSAKETGERITGGTVDAYEDFREVLDRPDIDIVHVPTPPHWHGLISIAAAEAGKDVWCEKPMTRTIGEGIKLVEAVQRNGRIFRLNTWFRFSGGLYGFGSSAKQVKKVVENGLLGWPLTATVGGVTGFNWKFGWSGRTNLKPQPIPKELNYDLWLGPAPVKPYNPHRVHATFRGYWDYDGGGLGDMGMHYLDPVQYFLEKDHTSPTEIEADTPQQDLDAASLWRRIELKYADGCKIILDGENKDKNAPFLEGPKGKLFPGLRSDIPDLEKKLAELPDPEPQVTDFHEAVRKRHTFALNDQNGHRSCTIVNLAKIAVRLARPLHFDPVKQEFVGDPGANRFIWQPMRAPWHL